MKRLLHIIFFISFLGVVSACSSEDKDNQYGMEDPYDRYGVGKWDNEKDFTVRRYYTLVDTFSVKDPNVSVVVKVTSDIKTDVTWVIDNVNYKSSHVDDPSSTTADLIIRTYKPAKDSPFTYLGGTDIKAYVTVGKNKIEREATIKEEKFERNVFGVNFGMDSIEVREDLETLYGISRFSMRSETIGVDLVSPHFLSNSNGRTLYIFEDNELVEVAEFPSMIWAAPDGSAGSPQFVLNDSFVELCRRLGYDGEIEVTEDGKLAEEYEWYNDKGIIFRLHMRDDVFPVGPVEIPDENGEGDGDDDGSRALPSRNGEDEENEDEEYLMNSIGISYTIMTEP